MTGIVPVERLALSLAKLNPSKLRTGWRQESQTLQLIHFQSKG